MKSILMSIRPEWVAEILNGKKTIEIRKTAPKCELPIEVYIYCTKGGLPLEYIEGHGLSLSIYNPQSYKPKDLRGKVVAKFTLRKVEKFLEGGTAIPLYTDCEIMRKACVSLDELDEYGNKSHCNGDPTLYAYHISDLVIFDKPKELSEFGVKRAPQSWQYIEVKE